MSTASRPSDSWHGALRSAIGHCAAGRLLEALSCYDRAVSAVDALLGGSSLTAPLLMAKTVSHLHRAAVLDRLDRTRAADREYRSAWAFARAVADDVHQPGGPAAGRLLPCAGRPRRVAGGARTGIEVHRGRRGRSGPGGERPCPALNRRSGLGGRSGPRPSGFSRCGRGSRSGRCVVDDSPQPVAGPRA
ncbi:MAG: hypothetical protein V2J02_18700 [Pseudomonadales bacterium]|jgi:hypothetical protein|nr:hypothetical protein [Pseudomonadales bacterium]